MSKGMIRPKNKPEPRRCIYCNTKISSYNDCDDCFSIRGMMSKNNYINQASRITLYGHKGNKYLQFKRPSGHKNCRNRLCTSRGRVSDFLTSRDRHGGNLTTEKFNQLKKKPCYYCGYRSMGVDRVDSERGYDEDNVVPCCSLCNYMKNDYDINFFLRKMASVYRINN